LARLLLVDPDKGRRATLTRMLRQHGHAVIDMAGPIEALESFRRTRAELVLAVVDELGGPGRPLARAMGEDARTRLVWMGAPSVHTEVRRDGAPIAGFLPLPPPTAALDGMLQRLVGDPGPRWSGHDFLDAIEGGTDRFPVPRVLFLAHRLSATGRLNVTHEGSTMSVDMRAGEVVGLGGIPGLLAGHGVDGNGTLEELVSAAMALGHQPNQVLTWLGEGIGRWCVGLPCVSDCNVAFEVEIAAKGAGFPLPLSVPQMIARGLKSVRPADVVRVELGRRRTALVRIQLPDDAPESRWGLPPTALRMVREATRIRTLGELLGSGPGGERPETWEAADLLIHLGFIGLDESERPSLLGLPDEDATTFVPEDDLSELESGLFFFEEDSARLPPDEPQPEAPGGDADPMAEKRQRLKSTFLRLKHIEPVELFVIESSQQASPEGVEEAFRKVSANYHPDRYAKDSEQIQRLASQCFGLVADARDQLLADTAGLELLHRKLKAAEAGEHYISASEAEQAHTALKELKRAAQRREWQLCLELADQVLGLDPERWEAAFIRVQARRGAGLIAPGQVVQELDALEPSNKRGRAQVLYYKGEVLLADGKDSAAFSSFRAAVAADETHTDAKRRLRLRELRQSRKGGSDEDGSVGKTLSRLFGRKD